MVAFVQGRPVTTREPVVTVDPGIPVGQHRFQLVVVDTAGLRSRPDTVVVRIVAGTAGPIGVIVPPAPPPPVRTRRDRSPP